MGLRPCKVSCSTTHITKVQRFNNWKSSVKWKKLKIKDPCIDYSSNLVKEMLLLGGGCSTLCCQISNPLTVPVWQAWVLQEKATNKIPSKGLRGAEERKCGQLFFLCRKGRLNNRKSGEKANKSPIQAKISCSWGEAKQLEPIQPGMEVRAPKTELGLGSLPLAGRDLPSKWWPHVLISPLLTAYAHKWEPASFVIYGGKSWVKRKEASKQMTSWTCQVHLLSTYSVAGNQHTYAIWKNNFWGGYCDVGFTDEESGSLRKRDLAANTEQVKRNFIGKLRKEANQIAKEGGKKKPGSNEVSKSNYFDFLRSLKCGCCGASLRLERAGPESLPGTADSRILTWSKSGLALFPGLLGFPDPPDRGTQAPVYKSVLQLCWGPALDPDILGGGDTSLSSFWDSHPEPQPSYSHLTITSLNYILNI